MRHNLFDVEAYQAERTDQCLTRLTALLREGVPEDSIKNTFSNEGLSVYYNAAKALLDHFPTDLDSLILSYAGSGKKSTSILNIHGASSSSVEGKGFEGKSLSISSDSGLSGASTDSKSSASSDFKSSPSSSSSSSSGTSPSKPPKN